MQLDYPSYLEPLNSEQRRAVLHTGKPLLILAGAGSGKTRVITTKIAWLIREQGMDPRSILAVTFTNKAAKEMIQRARQIEERAGDAMLRTFHSFGAWFLRRNGSIAGLDSGFVIYDDDDVVSLLSSIMENTSRPDIRFYANSISRAKDYFLGPDDPGLGIINHHKKFRDIYKRYEERLAQIGNVDFGDLIKKPVEILRSHPEVTQRFRDRFSVIMVDEYQDANVAQFHLLKELCGPSTYVCVVGDDDQSIYRFRGAEVKNILEFPDRFSGADIIRLEQNYRSTSSILKAASSVVDKNKGRLGKTLFAEKGDGSNPELVSLFNQDEEASFCADKIENSVKKKETTWSDWAILYRTNAQSSVFETLFSRRRIPYNVVGSLEFYKREEIKDALALLSFLVNQRDEVAFRRAVNKPARGIGIVTVHKIIETSITSGENLLEISRKLKLSQKARTGLNEFIKLIEDGQALLDGQIIHQTESKKQKLKSGKGLSVCVDMLINNSGLAKHYKMQDEISGNSKIDNLQQLLNNVKDYPNTREGLLEFLENINLDRTLAEEQKDAKEAVTLITLHNTKGLEFKRVIMTGLEQGTFPREDKKGSELEEERRLFYVGATRAMDELYLTTCKQRFMWGRYENRTPSLFLLEVDKSVLKGKLDGGSRQAAFPMGRQFPKSFNPFNLANNELEERSGWRVGQRIFHDNHGYGAVTEIKDSDDGPLVRVRFENGHDKRFLSEFQGRAYEKIGDDY
ncbi:MAG: ATP-dependent helicase [Treponema sp.]|jgi:DNA helicase-2/ATP-dependent DNA helicase PcrA|nr:ATP-dependent helicase [Treponema sp.]